VITRPLRLVLLGHPVVHSLSPIFQNAALHAAQIPLRYEAMDVAPDALAGIIPRLAGGRSAGNVTLPHKESFAALCATRTPVAERVGAVNVFWTSDDGGGLIGDNTDVGGFDFAARRLLGRDPVGLTVAILGAGGSAAAVCEAVFRWPQSRVVIHSRTKERADALAVRYAAIATTASGEMELVDQADLLVNATPLGLSGSLMPIAPGMIPSKTAVMDLTYRRGRTPWAQACRARGLQSDDGLPMLVEQGALAFERWFGVPPDREAMWRAVRA
jgi:shikimate dehydrogenase